MPLELQIIRADEFIRLGPKGRLNLETSREDLRKLAEACRRRGIGRALIDLREMQLEPKPMLTPTDLASLVRTFSEIGFTREQRLALLYKADPHRGARLFALIGTLSGWSVQAFSDFEEAIVWLSAGEDPDCGEKADTVQLNRRGGTKTSRERTPPSPR